jgi:hypothetical protein
LGASKRNLTKIFLFLHLGGSEGQYWFQGCRDIKAKYTNWLWLFDALENAIRPKNNFSMR